MIVKKAAECGISSPSATIGVNIGILPYTCNLFQRLGRCGRYFRSDDNLCDEFIIILTVDYVVESAELTSIDVADNKLKQIQYDSFLKSLSF